jgi:WD40 repeat protein
MKFCRDSKRLVAAGEQNIYFIVESTDKSGFSSVPVNGWKQDRVHTVPALAIAFAGNDVVVGCQNSRIVHCKGQSLFRYLRNHTDRVGAMATRLDDKGFVSGSADGFIIIWDEKAEQVKSINLNNFVQDLDILDVKVRAVTLSHDCRRISIGTRSADILEGDLESLKLKAVSRGHFRNRVRGLAMVPTKDEFVTCGEDYVVVKWSIESKKMITRRRIPFKAECCDVSSDGSMLVIGCNNGKFLVWSLETMKPIQDTISDREMPISCVKFSPDCKYLAVGSKDSQVIIYSVDKKLKIFGYNKQHKSGIHHMDWSENSLVLQTNDADNQLLYYSIEKKEVVPDGIVKFNNEKWATWSCIVGWPCLGIWAATSDGKDINSVDRSKAMTTLATCDDFGKVKLFKYPSIVEYSSYNSFSGHSSSVAKVRFSAKQDHLISLGSTDKCVFQWKYIKKGEDNLMGGLQADENDPNDMKVKMKGAGTMGGGLFEMEGNMMGDNDFVSEKQYIIELRSGNLTPNKRDSSTRENEVPEGNLYPVYTFGYNAQTKNIPDGIKFGDSDGKHLIFANAGLGVVMDTSTNPNTQRFFNKHRDEINTFDLTKDGKFCATGTVVSPDKKEGSLLPEIYIWNTETCEEFSSLNEFHRKGISVLRFSKRDTFLLTIGRDDNNCLAVYDWRNERLICSSKVDKNRVHDASWSSETKFVTVGSNHIKFWQIKTTNVTAVNGVWGKDKPESLKCCIHVDKLCFTGDAKGSIACWDNCIKQASVEAHKGSVNALASNSAGNNLITGGNDGLVKIWKLSGNKIEGNLQVIDPSQRPNSRGINPIKSVDMNKKNAIVIGTKNSEILIYSPDKKEISEVLCGHSGMELWGLACHPYLPDFVTSGGDNYIRMWSITTKLLLKEVKTQANCRALDWSAHGYAIVAIDIAGKVSVYDNLLNLRSELQSNFSQSDDWVEDIKFSAPESPEDKKNEFKVAFGCHGRKGVVQVLECSDFILKPFKIIPVTNGSGIIHLDWSVNSKYLVVNTDQYEIKFINVEAGAVVRSVDCKDMAWSTWTCTLGYPVQGIIATSDPNDVNSVCRSKNQKLMAIGDDFNNVKLFNYPSTSNYSGSKRFLGHSSLITKVKFMLEDNCLVSIGGQDRAIIVWATDFGGPNDSKKLFIDDYLTSLSK